MTALTNATCPLCDVALPEPDEYSEATCPQCDRSWERLPCLDRHAATPCRGPVNFHSTDPGRRPAFPRCDRHWDARLDRRKNSLELYADSAIPPPWFDPSIAGERWDDE